MNDVKQLLEQIKSKGLELFDLLKNSDWDKISEFTDPDVLKLAINYEEKNTQNYTAAEMIKWFREKYKAGIDGCVYMVKNTEKNTTIYELHHVFIDREKKEPCLDGSHSYMKVVALNIDDDIQRMFKDKDMIILR